VVQSKHLFDEASDVEAIEGVVDVEGPDDVAVALTPEAAEETSDRLLDKAQKARGQKRLNDLPHKPKE
jgi:hypothetical protein